MYLRGTPLWPVLIIGSIEIHYDIDKYNTVTIFIYEDNTVIASAAHLTKLFLFWRTVESVDTMNKLTQIAVHLAIGLFRHQFT